ncbi:MAG: ABC transporter substrate-binding protein [Anaerolineales bacterium]
MKRKHWSALAGILMLALVLSACQPEAATPETVVKTVIVEKEGETIVETVEVEKEVVVEPTPEPVTRQGAWVDTVVFVEEPSSDTAITRLETGDIDLYAFAIAEAPLAERIYESKEIDHYTSYGSYNELTFNPVMEFEDGTFNPFGDPQIREAMNWLIDRDYITQEIQGGMARPRYVPINFASADTARLADVIAEIELKYAYDKEKAKEVVTARMEELGAEWVDGLWQYEGGPVELTGLIRVEDERKEIGDYFANQLEDLGFTVIRDYKTSAEASTCWISSDPATGCFSYYTGGWVTTAISRDEATNYPFFYTDMGYGVPLWQAYETDPDFYQLCEDLNNNIFDDMAERREKMAEATRLALEDSARVWLSDSIGISPIRKELSVAADLSGSTYGAAFWPHTLRYEDRVGGEATIAMPSMMTQAWNPVNGSNWVYDHMPQDGVAGAAVLPDPFTGLNVPVRLESATVYAKKGLPIGKTMDWVELEFVDEITVPDDAWADWDAENQVWITAAERFEESPTAKTKVVMVYEEDFPENTTWHDGSPFGVEDMIFGMIMNNFDIAKEGSPIYDEAEVPAFDSFMSAFKGWRITSTDPVTVEYYTDAFQLDAENNVTNFRAAWPEQNSGLYPRGGGAWHNMTLAWLAEANGETAFSDNKAVALEVDQTNFLAGPTLEIMKGYLETALADAVIPYEPTLGEYITEEEAVARYENLQAFVERADHIYLGTGAFYIQKAFPIEGTIILQRYPDYPDMADRYSRFAEAPIPEVLLDGPGEVDAGDEAVFDVFIDFKGEPYANEDIDMVTYLVFDATGALAMKGDAEPVEDGQFQVTLDTSDLPAGSSKLAVITVSKKALIPVKEVFEFLIVE